jgi:hypothetical protein
MHTDSDPRPAPRAMDLMRPSQAFAVPPTSTLDDARRWMRLGLAALASALSLSVLLAMRARS